jgi:hypothetical protein
MRSAELPHATGAALRLPRSLSLAGERAVFAACVGLIALEVVTDAFVAPEPGTGASDHVVPAAVPLALLAGALWLDGRARPGVRAAVALLLAPVALVGAGLAVAHARGPGASGDDWTAFLMAPAGVALLVLGGRLLWRSRKPGRYRYVRRALVAVAALVAVYFVVVPVCVAVLATHRPRGEVVAADLGRPHRDITLRTSDGLELAAWWVPSRNGASVILFPRRGGSVDHARLLARRGYGVLSVDARGYDGSEGDPNAYGWKTTRDIDAAVDFLRARTPGRIGGLGLSVGGEQMLEAAAGNAGLRAVVSEGAGERSVRETLLLGPKAALAVPLMTVQTAATAVLSGDAPPPSLGDVMPRIAPRAVLLLWAAHGQETEELNETYYERAGRPKAIWKVPRGGHTGALETMPRDYESRVVGFFDRYLLGRRASTQPPVPPGR